MHIFSIIITLLSTVAHFVGQDGDKKVKIYVSPLVRSRDHLGCFSFGYFFSVFIFSMPSQSDNDCNTFYVLEHKYVLYPFSSHFNLRQAARAKLTLNRAQNIFIPVKIDSAVLVESKRTTKV